MNGAIYRQEAWDSKVIPATLLADIDAKKAGMLQSFTTAATACCAMELQVKQVCDGAGVPTIQYPFYLCFGREMWKKTRQEISGEALAIFAALQIAKWVGRGLTQAVLEAIRGDVFGVAAPIGP